MHDEETIESEEELEDIRDFDERAYSEDVMSFEEVGKRLGLSELTEE